MIHATIVNEIAREIALALPAVEVRTEIPLLPSSADEYPTVTINLNSVDFAEDEGEPLRRDGPRLVEVSVDMVVAATDVATLDNTVETARRGIRRTLHGRAENVQLDAVEREIENDGDYPVITETVTWVVLTRED